MVSEIQDGFIHPYFKLTPSMLVDIGFDAGTKLLLFRNPRFGTFARVKVGHVITVKENDHVFLKALDITDCAVFDQQCEVLTSKTGRPVHLRNNLPGEREYVRDAILADQLQKISQPTKALSRLSQPRFPQTKSSGKTKRLDFETPIDISSSDELYNVTSGRKRKHKGATCRRIVRPFSRAESIEVNGRPSTSASPSFPTSREIMSDRISCTSLPVMVKKEPEEVLCLRVLSGHGTTSRNAIELDSDYSHDGEEGDDEDVCEDNVSSYLGGLSNEDEDEIEVSKVWPGEFYAVDIVNGFLAIDKMMALGTTIETAFAFHFKGVRYVKTTYNDHLRRWQHASQHGKDIALAAGRTHKGLWSAFMADNPAPYAARKAAKKRLRNATMSERSSSPS